MIKRVSLVYGGRHRFNILILVSIVILLNVFSFYYPIWRGIGYDADGNIVSTREIYLFRASYEVRSSYYIVLDERALASPYSILAYASGILIIISTNIYLIYTCLLLVGGISSLRNLVVPFLTGLILSILGFSELIILLTMAPSSSDVFENPVIIEYSNEYLGGIYIRSWDTGFHLLIISIIIQVILLLYILGLSRKEA